MRLCARVLVCLWLATLISFGVASATQVLHLTPQQLGQDSEIVVRAKVLSTQSYWNGKHTKIFTRTDLAVDETYKGSPQGTVELVQLGGTVGTVKVTVQGALQWKVGEEVLVFAEPCEAGTYQVTGLYQGKYSIERDPRTGRAYVRAPATGSVTMLGAPGEKEQAKDAGMERIPIDEFVRQALGRR
jgi:hypothetical protein